MTRSRVSAAVLRCGAVAALIAATFSFPAAAANEISPEARATIEAVRAELQASREEVLSANLALTAEQADRFWPLYREYAAKRSTLGDERVNIILDYARAYPEVDDATASDLVARSLKHNRKLTDLTQNYARKFGKVLPPATLMRYLQIQQRLDALVELQLMRAIPMVEPKQ